MTPAAVTLEDRIRERAYHIWEANGRPSGRADEFWHQACEAIAAAEQPRAKVTSRRSKREQAQRKSARPKVTRSARDETPRHLSHNPVQ
jgi:ribosomal protein L4